MTLKSGIWNARGLIVALALVLAWYTWGHWGDTQIDCGREMYVPVAILKGKLLYRDVWNQYGPLALYIQALAFLIFGIKLNVLFGLGVVLTIVTALLLFEIGRRFELTLLGAMAPAIFFVAESYRPSIFNFVLPYSYSATIAACLGLACLYFNIQHALTGRAQWLLGATLFTSLALLTKQEFGLACLGALGFEASASCLRRRSWREFMVNASVCAAGLLPVLIGYGFFIWKVSAKTIFYDNWVMTPGTYTMQTIGHRMMATAGVRFGLREWTVATLAGAASVASWFLVGYLNALVVRKLGFQRIRSFILLVIADLAVALIAVNIGGSVWVNFPRLIGQIVFPKGIYVIGLFFMAHALWKVWQTNGQPPALADAALGIYASLTGIRVMMEMLPTSDSYAVFFNSATFLVFVLVIARMAGSGGRALDAKRRDLLVGYMLSAEVILLVIALWPPRDVLTTPLKTDFGTIYTEPDRAVLFPQIVSFMKTHTRNGKDILVVPESPSLYFFSGLESPTHWYEVQPGVLDPKQEFEFIKEVEASGVKYVLLCNRHVDEFGVAPFGIGYDQSIYKWIMSHHTKIAQFGPRADLPHAATYQPYVMEVYERKSAQ